MWLSKKDVESILDIGMALKAVEQAFLMHGLRKVQMPSKIYLYFPKGDLRAMPAYLEETNISGVKVVNVHPHNHTRSLPSVMAIVELVDPDTGIPLALMDGTYLTDMRTGAAGGIAVKYLARKNSSIVGMIGTGNQARTQLMAISHFIDIEEVRITSKSGRSERSFKEYIEKVVDADIHSYPVERVCDCDILVTTTPVRKPVVMDEWIQEGTHINAIGADAKGKQELDPLLLRRAKVVVDDIHQASHSGEINVPLEKGIISMEDIYGEIGEIVSGAKPGRENEEEITIFDSTGLAVQDVATAYEIYKKAIERGAGSRLEFI